MKTWLEHNLAEYKKEHQNLGNEICHFFGISLIVFSLLVLNKLFVPWFDLIMFFVFGIWFFVGGWRGLVAVAFFGFLFVFGLRYLETLPVKTWQVAVGIFIVGWIFQLVGHFVFEKNKPAFLKAPVSLLIAIFWLGEVVIFYPLWRKTK